MPRLQTSHMYPSPTILFTAVRKDFQVREDSAFAQHLQEQECKLPANTARTPLSKGTHVQKIINQTLIVGGGPGRSVR